MKQHIDVLGYLYIALGVLGLLVALFLLFVIAGGGLLSGDIEAIAITGAVGTGIAVFIALLSLPGFLAGYGLLKRYAWARVLAIVLGALNLLNIPFGTALGVYTFWVLLNEESAAEFL